MALEDDQTALQRIYRLRFGDPVADQTRQVTWQVLCEDWFPKFVGPSDCVLELGAGGCEFINNIKAGRKIAVDLNPDVKSGVGAGVEFVHARADDLGLIEDGSVDVVFSSNFFEHLSDAEMLLGVLAESRRVLRDGGLIITLMPNLAAVGASYFDFLDHKLALTDKSLVEALTVAGFEPKLVLPRFLPYTAAGRKKPIKPWAVRAYLRMPIAWRVLGGQMFVVGTRGATPASPE